MIYKEIQFRFDYGNTLRDKRWNYYNTLKNEVIPLVNELLDKKAIGKWHFILHESIDLRVEVLKEEELLDYETKDFSLDLDKYTNDIIYDLLYRNSLFILDIINSNKFVSLGFIEYINHLTSAQFGLNGMQEAFLMMSRFELNCNHYKKIDLNLVESLEKDL